MGNGWMIEEVQAGIASSIVPEKATAVLRAQGISADLQRMPAKVTAEHKNGRVTVTARGRSVHSSLPHTGDNALMTLLMYLDGLRPLPNAVSVMAGFAAAHIGRDLYGRGLGIQHRDPFMGPLTVSATQFETTPESAKLTINLRVPKGITTPRMEREIDTRIEAFQKARRVTFGMRKYLEDALYQDPDSPFVQRLLRVYNRVTGENRKAQSISGGTYAKRLPNALVFGPAMPDEEYLGHQPNEHIRISTLSKNLEILTEAMAEFAAS
jgi:dipeptidase D